MSGKRRSHHFQGAPFFDKVFDLECKIKHFLNAHNILGFFFKMRGNRTLKFGTEEVEIHASDFNIQTGVDVSDALKIM